MTGIPQTCIRMARQLCDCVFRSRVTKTQSKQGASLTEEVVFSSSEREKWQPIPQETLALLNNIVMAALG